MPGEFPEQTASNAENVLFDDVIMNINVPLFKIKLGISRTTQTNTYANKNDPRDFIVMKFDNIKWPAIQ